MASTRIANAHWEGSLKEGAGSVSLDSSNIGKFDVTWASRAEAPEGRTSPEELIAAAHSTCFNMSLSLALTKAGTPPQAVDTKAEVDFVPGTGITEIRLTVRAKVDGVSSDDFASAADEAKNSCPVSNALAGTTIKVDAALAT